MKIKTPLYRNAFTMIELLFAIVIISITMLTLPMMMQIDAGNQEDALAQEGIILTSTKIAQVLTFPWDPVSSPGGAIMTLSQVLDTANGDADLTRVAGTDFRLGHVTEKLRRRLSPVSAPRTASVIGGNVVPETSINDFNADVDNIGGAGGTYAYKKQWRLNTTVTYVDDTATYSDNNVAYDLPIVGVANPTNIKMVTVLATDVTPGIPGVPRQVRLRSYSSNIGEQEFYKRRY